MDERERARLKEDVLAFIRDDAEDDGERRFSALALRLWRWHVEELPSYGAFCRRRLGALDRARGWRDIPPLPVEAF
jgi:hypothetical protein